MTRAELLRALIAERWPAPAAAEQERPWGGRPTETTTRTASTEET
ncbi:hypothetical protein [Micromonospora rubida]